MNTMTQHIVELKKRTPKQAIQELERTVAPLKPSAVSLLGLMTLIQWHTQQWQLECRDGISGRNAAASASSSATAAAASPVSRSIAELSFVTPYSEAALLFQHVADVVRRFLRNLRPEHMAQLSAVFTLLGMEGAFPPLSARWNERTPSRCCPTGSPLSRLWHRLWKHSPPTIRRDTLCTHSSQPCTLSRTNSARPWNISNGMDKQAWTLLSVVILFCFVQFLFFSIDCTTSFLCEWIRTLRVILYCRTEHSTLFPLLFPPCSSDISLVVFCVQPFNLINRVCITRRFACCCCR
jgi:hypothetical protein